MAGRMGGKNRTVKNLTVVEVRGREQILVLHGSVPGNRGICVEVAKQ
jgi:ribosomal protein L3